MLYIGPVDIPGSDDHEGFVSARTSDGRDTGIWTDVRDGAPGYTGFRAGCECGWFDDGFAPPDDAGHQAALHAFVHRHFAVVAGGGVGGLDPARDFLSPWAVRVRSAAHA